MTSSGGEDDDPAPDRNGRWRRVAERRYRPDRDRGLTSVVLAAVADAEGMTAGEVHSPPLYEAVDVEAVESVFFGPDVGTASRDVTGVVKFRYAQYLVEVQSEGRVRVHEPIDGT